MTVPQPDDERFMALAIRLGRRGLGQVWPNPAVGAVIVQSGHVVGRGATAAGGRPHAETVALEHAGRRGKGATAYVSLEPCAHHGQTPPCAEALIAAGVTRVVTSLSDPDPRVSGRGHSMLREAGVDVREGVLSAQAEEANAGFLMRVRHGRPWVTLKLASSLDGRIATATGESQWITAPEARRFVHVLRHRHDAVLVGGGTARADDPNLTARGLGHVRQPVRIVASRHLNVPVPSRLTETISEGPVWYAHGAAEGDVDALVAEKLQHAGAELLSVPVGRNRNLDPAGLLRVLGERGLTRVFCEGGGALAASLLSADLVDELIAFGAGIALGAEGRPSVGALGVDKLAEAPSLRLVDTREVGPDILTRWRRA